ncbi:MAG: hypothetical protein KTR35_21690 [Gammaproteobacteria bacterium]|nr:hypothetical protein [Gammaproteobacteria bacterium]
MNPSSSKKGMAKQLESRFKTGVLAEENGSQQLTESAIKLVNRFDTYLFDTDVKVIIGNAPVFQTPGYPVTKETAKEAMGRYQLWLASLTLSLPPHYTPTTVDEHFGPAAGLTMFTMVVFYIQSTRKLPMSTFESYATSNEMGILIDGMQDEPKVRKAFTEDCAKPLNVFLSAIS